MQGAFAVWWLDSLNHDVMKSFRIHKCQEPQHLSQVVCVLLRKAATLCLWTAYQCAQTLCMSYMDGGSTLRWLSALTMT